MPYSSFSIHSKKAEIKSGRGLLLQFCASTVHDQTIQQYPLTAWRIRGLTWLLSGL